MMVINQDKLVNGCGLQHSHSQNVGVLPRQRAESLCACEALSDYWIKHDKRPATLPTGCEAGQNFTGYAGYWSSSPNANNSNNAWIVNFNNGNDNWNNKNNNNYVRLVRSGE